MSMEQEEKVKAGIKNFYESSSAGVTAASEVNVCCGVTTALKKGCEKSPWLINTYMVGLERDMISEWGFLSQPCLQTIEYWCLIRPNSIKACEKFWSRLQKKTKLLVNEEKLKFRWLDTRVEIGTNGEFMKVVSRINLIFASALYWFAITAQYLN